MAEAEKDHLKEAVIHLGISTCLLGEPVRYDGGHKLDRYLTGTLGQFFEWVPVLYSRFPLLRMISTFIVI